MPPFLLFTFLSCALCPCSFLSCHPLIFALGVIPLTLTWFVLSLFRSFCARRWVVRPPLPYLWPLLLCPPCLFRFFFGLPLPSPFSLASSGSSFPSGVVPGLSGRRLVQDFQHRPYFPPSLWFAVLFSYFPLSLSVLPYLTSVPVWYFWPQTGQGYHSAGSPQSFQPGTVSGRRLVQGLLPSNTDSWNFLLDSKLSKLGSNLTPKHNSMTFWKPWVCIKIFPLSTA